MPTLDVSMSITYGDPVANGSTPWRKPFAFTLAYTEESVKTVAIPANTVAFPVDLDTVSAPKFLFVRAVETDVIISLVNGADNVPTTLAAASGWVMLCNPAGQAVSALTVTTPASPTTGARVQILAFE